MTNTLGDYVEAFKLLGLSELSVEDEGVKLYFKKNSSCEPEIITKPINENKVETPKEEVKQGTPVKSPLLGGFFSQVNGKELKAGDAVKKGDVLCSIEAMKMMNDVTAPCDGVISKVNAKEGDLVEYDQILFEIA